MFSWIGPLKPLLSALILPPVSPLLLIFAGLLLLRFSKRWAQAALLSGALLLWVLSCSATAYGLNQLLLRIYPPIAIVDLQKAQAIVVLGGGVELHAPEYGQPILSPLAHQRLVYGRYLKTLHDLPLVYSGGKGWGDREGVAGEEIVALCDVDQRSLQAAAKLHPAARLFRDYRRMLAEVAELEAVTISTPDHHHAPAEPIRDLPDEG